MKPVAVGEFQVLYTALMRLKQTKTAICGLYYIAGSRFFHATNYKSGMHTISAYRYSTSLKVIMLLRSTYPSQLLLSLDLPCMPVQTSSPSKSTALLQLLCTFSPKLSLHPSRSGFYSPCLHAVGTGVIERGREHICLVVGDASEDEFSASLVQD